MGVAHLRLIGDLSGTTLAAKLHADLMDLPESGCTHRFTVGQAAAVGIDRQFAADLGDAVGEQLFLITVRTKTIFGHVHDFCTDFGVLQLSDVDIVGTDTRQLEGGLRSSHRGRVGDFGRLRGAKDLEATVVS